jgi:feruloyl esterase
VESGRQPGRIVASNAVNGTVTRTRPVYPYPTVARYDGTGSIDDAANFVAYTPPDQVHNDDNWVGRALYSHGYQTWPRAVDGKLVIRPARTPSIR